MIFERGLLVLSQYVQESSYETLLKNIESKPDNFTHNRHKKWVENKYNKLYMSSTNTTNCTRH